MVAVVFVTACATVPHGESTMLKHHSAGGFKNPYADDGKKSFWDMLRWKVFGEGARGSDAERKGVSRAPLDVHALRNPGKAPQVTWIGHSTTLVQMGGRTILTDPIFSLRCSPVGFAGPKRYQKPALTIEDLPQVDIAVISHNHYDHLDKPSVEALGDEVHWVVPLGLKQWFASLGITRVTELDWWGQLIHDDIRVVATPAQHWSARGIGDRFETLWASWLIEVDGTKFWFGGDTGYNPIQFKEIGAKFGPIDLAAIPIGAYEPRWFMKTMHVNPSEALDIHRDIGAQWSFGIHWGTFQLTDEAPLEPKEELLKARAQRGLTEDDFTTLAIGETFVVQAAREFEATEVLQD